MAFQAKKARASQPSLGAATLSAQPAAGFYNPQQGLLSGLDIFIEHHGGPAVYNGLFTSCRQGRDWVLCNASKGTLSIDTAEELTPAEWARRLDAARQALQTRGALPTDVVLLAQEPSSTAACRQCLEALNSQLRSLTIVGCRRLDWDILRDTDTAFQHLTSLTVKDAFCTLPGPSDLPLLTRVDFQCDREMPKDCVKALAAHLPRLTSLRLPKVKAKHWDRLFKFIPEGPKSTTNSTPTNTNPTTVPTPNPHLTTHPNPTTNPTPNPNPTNPHILTHLTTTGTVDAQLLEQLLMRATALTHWTVVCAGNFAVRRGLAHEQWGLRVLRVEGKRAEVGLERLMRLPKPTEGRVDLDLAGCKGLSVNVDEDSDSDTDSDYSDSDSEVDERDLWFEGLRHYRLTSGNVRLSPGWGLGPVNRAQAAHTTLTQLRALEMTGDAAVHMSEWVWTPQLAQVCSTTLPDRKFDVTIDTLTDEQLTAIMHFGPNLRKVSVRGAVALRLDHSHVAWPWPEAGLHVGGKRVGIDVGQAVRLPRMPLGSLSGKEILLTTKVIKEVGVERATGWARSTLAPNGHWKAYMQCEQEDTADSEQCAKLLADMLTVLRAVPWDSTAPDARASVYLQRWPMTRQVMQALRGLPEWSVLDFGSEVNACTWPLDSKRYKALATYIPRSYTDWCVYRNQNSLLYKRIFQGKKKIR